MPVDQAPPPPSVERVPPDEWRPPIVDAEPPIDFEADPFAEEHRAWRSKSVSDGGTDSLLEDDDEIEEDLSDLDFAGATQARAPAPPQPAPAQPAPSFDDRSSPKSVSVEAPTENEGVSGIGMEDLGDMDDLDLDLDPDEHLIGAPTDPDALKPVDCTVFGPSSARIGEDILIQAVLHLTGADADALDTAQAADPEAERRVGRTFAQALAPGQTVTVSLDIPGAEIEPPRDSCVWRGDTDTLQFTARFDEARPGGSSLAKLRISVDGLPVASAIWRIAVLDANTADPAEDDAAPLKTTRYSSAFVSYASEDRDEVLKRVQTLKTLGVEVFVDLLSLDPGERWERQLYENIEKSDAFLLFWSRNSAKSEWVEKEWRYALEKAAEHDQGTPEIRPIILERSPPPPPPELSTLHFRDALAYLIKSRQI